MNLGRENKPRAMLRTSLIRQLSSEFTTKYNVYSINEFAFQTLTYMSSIA